MFLVCVCIIAHAYAHVCATLYLCLLICSFVCLVHFCLFLVLNATPGRDHATPDRATPVMKPTTPDQHMYACAYTYTRTYILGHINARRVFSVFWVVFVVMVVCFRSHTHCLWSWSCVSGFFLCAFRDCCRVNPGSCRALWARACYLWLRSCVFGPVRAICG